VDDDDDDVIFSWRNKIVSAFGSWIANHTDQTGINSNQLMAVMEYDNVLKNTQN
jgi:hypothetical protein